MRSKAREGVFKYLFSKLFNPGDEGLFDVLIKELCDDDKSFANELLKAALDGENKYTATIDALSERFRERRIFAADKCALILGMAELDSFPNTPTAVIVDEAVKLASTYSTEKSADFVNGILAEYAKDRK